MNRPLYNIGVNVKTPCGVGVVSNCEWCDYPGHWIYTVAITSLGREDMHWRRHVEWELSLSWELTKIQEKSKP